MNAPPPWSRRLAAELHAADERAAALAGSLSEAQLNWKPSPQQWSVGQCLEHLAVSTELYLPPIDAALAGASPGIADEITPGGFSRWFIRNYIAPSPRRAKAPGKIAPASQVDARILDRFLDGNRKTRELIERAARYDVNRIRFKNPFVPLLRFTVGTGLEIVAKHASRHLLQAERVKAAPGFPSS
jgi:hypothetical protein